ncbi:MAG: hypothetical protein IT373_25390 [Polyangiaceae bacterium]|nr:hypothetical protein [Polyangiaceae bacterium]
MSAQGVGLSCCPPRGWKFEHVRIVALTAALAKSTVGLAVQALAIRQVEIDNPITIATFVASHAAIVWILALVVSVQVMLVTHGATLRRQRSHPVRSGGAERGKSTTYAGTAGTNASLADRKHTSEEAQLSIALTSHT